MANNTPDVRVRLSAEGVQEVVNALKQVQNQAKKTGDDGAGAFKKMNGALEVMKGLLLADAVKSLATSFAGLAKSAIDAGVAIQRLSDASSVSVQTLSAMNFAAQQAGVSSEEMVAGVKKALESIDKLKSNDTGAGEVFRRIGLAAKDFKGLNADQSVRKLVDTFAQYNASAQKSAVANEILGDSGSKLTETLDRLGVQGFDQLVSKAGEAGALFSEQFTQDAAAANNALLKMRTQTTAAANQFTAKFIPSVSAAMDVLQNELGGKGNSVWSKFGEIAGHVVRALVGDIIIFAKAIGNLGAAGEVVLPALWESFKKVLSGDFSGAKDAWTGVGTKLVGIWSNFKKGAAETFNDLSTKFDETQKAIEDGTAKAEKATSTKPKGKDVIAGRNLDQEKEIAAARLSLAQAQAAAELSLLQAKNKQIETVEQAKYDQGLESLKDYYAKRRELSNAESDKEMAVLQRELKAAKAMPALDVAQEIGKQQKIVEVQNKIDLANQARKQKDIEFDRDQTNATRDLMNARLDLEANLANAQGDRHKAAMIALEKELQETEKLLTKQGVGAKEKADVLNKQRTQGTANADFDQAAQKAQLAFTGVNDEVQKINDQVQAGLLFQFQAEDQIAALEQARLQSLRELSAEMVKQAELTGDPEKIQQAQQFAMSVEQMAISSDKAAKAMAEFKKTLEESLTGAFSNFLSEGIKSADGIGAAFRGMAFSIVNSMQQMLSQLLAQMLMKKLLSSLSGAGGGGLGSLVSSFGSAFAGGFATGGLIRGPGTGTSDSIIAAVSAGEHITRAAVVAQPGAMEFLNRFNQVGMRALSEFNIPRFADGGLVEVGGTTPGATSMGNGSLTVGLDDGLVLKHMSSPAGVRMFLDMASKNRRAVKQALGV